MKIKIAGVGAVVAIAAIAITAVALGALSSGISVPAPQLAGNIVVQGIEGGDPGSPSIEVESWSWGISFAGSFASGGGGGLGKATFKDLTIVKPIDKSSPKLALACANGDHIPVVTLTVLRPGKATQPYMEYRMTDVFISSVKASGSGDDLPLEEVSFTYRRIELKYTTVDGVVVQSQLDSTGSS